MRAKYFLNKLKFISIEQIGIGISTDLRCIFQIVYPGINIQYGQKGTPVNQSCLVSFRSISKKQYLKAKISKTAFSQQFGKQLQLSKQVTECCVFQLKYAEQNASEKTIVSGQNIIIKIYGEQLYMNVLQDEQQVYFSQSSKKLTLKKQKRKLQNFIPQYYKISSNKFDSLILSNPIDLQNISQKKQILNISIINQLNIETKINSIVFIQYNFNKIIEQDLKFIIYNNDNNTQINLVFNCWEFIQCQVKNQNNLVHIYNPITQQGFIIKHNKNCVKLTSNLQQLTLFKINHRDEDVVYLSTENPGQQIDIIYDRIAEKQMMILSKQQTQNSSKLIKIKQITTKSAYMLCEMSEILDILKDIYDFLNTWGFEVNQKSQTICYSVKQIKLGSTSLIKKMRELKLVFKILKNYMVNPEYSVHQIRNIINSMKILEMLINICKVITIKIGYNYPILQQDIYSPFCFAKNNLQKILKSLFLIILRTTTDNIHNSNLIISQVNYFNQILIAYPQQIGEILQQAIKNLSTFSTKSNSNGSNQLFLWVKLIQPLREDNIRIQKTYIDIISEVVVDPSDRGIPQYQNKCKQLLFANTVKRKGIPRFGIDEVTKKPLIVLQKQWLIKDILEKNEYLQKYKVMYLNSVSYNIQGFFNEKIYSLGIIVEQYLGYICSIIKMFRNLCRNRNKKLFKIVDDLGIKQQHIKYVFNSKMINWELKSHYLNLWTTIYIDQDPFLSFEKRESKCHLWNKIQKYNLQDCTAIIFKQYTDQNIAIIKLNEFGIKIYPILSNFFQQFLISGSSIFVNNQMLKCLPIILNTIYQMINFGYMTLKSMKQYISIIVYILTNMIQKNSGSKRPTQTQILKFHHNIILTSIKILILYQDIWVQIYGLIFIKNFNKNIHNKSYPIQQQLIEQQWQNIIKNKFNQFDQVEKQVIKKRIRFTPIINDCENFYHHEKNKNYQVRHGHYSFQDVDNQILDYVVNLLAKRILQRKCQAYQQLINLINKKISRRERVCAYLKQIVILNNEKQQQIYINFSGREQNKLLNWLKIQEIVEKINQIQNNNNVNDQTEGRIKKQKILELNNTLIKINREIYKYQVQNCYLLKKCQLILQKFNIHIILIDLLKYIEKNQYKELIKTIFQFFCLFIYENDINCKSLAPNVDKFIKKLDQEELVIIIPTLIQKSQDRSNAYKTAHELIFKIAKNVTTLTVLKIIDKLLNIEQNSQHTKKLKNNLTRRIIQQYDIKKYIKQIQNINYSKQQNSKYQFYFVKLLCKLVPQCPQLQNRIKNIYNKCELLQKFKNCQNYKQKKIYFKIFVEIYIRYKSLQNFQIEDYFKIIVYQQLLKIPPTFISLIKNMNKNNQRQLKIHRYLQQLLSFSPPKIELKDQQAFFDFIFDHNDNNQISMLTFCKILIYKWKTSQRSNRIQKCRSYMKKLQKFLFLIFFQQNTAYQRQLFQQIEAINLNLQNVVSDNCQNIKQQKLINENIKQEIIKFYNKLSIFIRQQNISICQLLNCFGVEYQKLKVKRENVNISHNITQQEFMNGFYKLGSLMKRKYQYHAIIDNSDIFKFIYIHKDVRSKKIDVYNFIDKLMSVLEYNKSIKVQQVIKNNKNKQDTNNTDKNSNQLNSYNKKQQTNENQYTIQVQTFCKVSQSYKNIISQTLSTKIKQLISVLDKKLINEWVNDPSLNIYKISQYYECQLLYSLVLNVLQKSTQLCTNMDNHSNDGHFKNIPEYLKFMTIRFIQKSQLNILILFNQLFNKFQHDQNIVEKFYKVIEKIYDKLIYLIFNQKCQGHFFIIKCFKSFFITVLNNPYAPQNFKTKMKYKIVDTIIRFIRKGINLYSFYSYRVMQVLLMMWSENELQNQVQNSKLMQDPDFIRWVQMLLSSQSLKKMIVTNIKQINKANFARLIVKTIIKFQQNHQGTNKIFKNTIQQFQRQSTTLFNLFVVPKKKAFIEQLYCCNFPQCSQAFCNNYRITQNDENLLNLLLNLFIICRLYLAKNQRSARSIVSGLVDLQIHNMVGHIKYKIYDRDKKFNFRLPSCQIFSNVDSQRSIEEEIQNIPNQHLYMYLHALSKVYHKQVKLISSFDGILYPIKLIFSKKSMVKGMILGIFLIIIILHLNTNYLQTIQIKNRQINNPIILVICVIFMIIQLLFFCLEIRTFKNKCYHYFPLKYAQTNKEKTYQFYKNKSFVNINNKKKQQNNLKDYQINIKKQNNQIRYHKNIVSFQNILTTQQNNVQQKKQQKYSIQLTWKQIIQQIFNSMIPIHFIQQLVFFANFWNPQFFIVLFIFLIFDMQQPRKIMKRSKKAIQKMLICFIPFIIVSDLILTHYLQYLRTSYKEIQFSDAIILFMIKLYSVIQLGDIQSNQLKNSLEIFVLIGEILFGFCVIGFIAYVSEEIYKAMKDKEKKKNKCCICLKTKQQIQDKKQNFKYHIENQHRFWDYIYFFIQYDRKGKLEGIHSQIDKQIQKGDYRFIKLY